MFEYANRADTHKERWERKTKRPKKLARNKIDVLEGLLISKQSFENTPLIKEIRRESSKNEFNIEEGLQPLLKKKRLGLAALTVLIFYEVCGGPFGLEVAMLWATLDSILMYCTYVLYFPGYCSSGWSILCTSWFRTTNCLVLAGGINNCRA